MNRPILTCVILAFAAAALSAQQSNSSSPYQGTSNPPADTIETSVQEQPQPVADKPPAGRPLENAPATAAPQTAQQPYAAANPSLVDRSANNRESSTEEGSDAGIVQVAPPEQDARSTVRPALATRAYSDPDGDIVHPGPLPPGTLGEGARIRVRLLTRLSTSESIKGDSFRSRVASDVLQDGQVLIPAGAEIEGHVVEVSSGHTGGHGSMRLRPETVILPNGNRYRIDAQISGTPGAHARVAGEGVINADSRKKKDGIEYGGAVGAGAITGAVLGGPVGALAGSLIGAGAITVHLLVDHPQATLEPGTTLLFTLTEPLNLVASGSTGN
jgi:hypothetical protein